MRSLLVALAVGFFVCTTVVNGVDEEQISRPPTPPFLIGSSEKVINEFFEQIEKLQNKTDQEIVRELEKWVATLGPSYVTKFREFLADLKKGRAEYERQHSLVAAKFSPPAKAADAKMNAIANSQTLNGIQKRQQIRAIMDGLPENVRQEILNAIGAPLQPQQPQ